MRNVYSWLVPVLLAVPLCGVAQESSVLVPTPRASLVASSPTNRPFLAAAGAAQPVDLAVVRYVEEEYVLGGLADRHAWGATGTDPVQVSEADVPYATRMLVRRPADVRRFSGRVVVELMDGAGGHDTAALWGLSHRHFTARGDAWVGVTVSPRAVASLQRFDPVRYATLEFPAAQPPDCRPGTLAWAIVAQAGALLRSSSKENPLLPLEVRQLVAAGSGESARLLVAYANTLHGQLRLGGGQPVYDAFLAAEGGASEGGASEGDAGVAGGDADAAGASCAVPLVAGDARLAIRPRDVPFVAVATQGDPGAWLPGDSADSDGPGSELRVFEIAGAPYSARVPAGQPSVADLAIAGFPASGEVRCAGTASDLPVGYVFDAIWQQLFDRLATGTPLGREPRITRDASGAVMVDEDGNAQGGWRLPQLTVPLAVYSAIAPAVGDDEASQRLCAERGVLQRLDASRLKQLYGNRAGYLARFRAAVDADVQARRLTAEDAESIKSSVAASVPAF